MVPALSVPLLLAAVPDPTESKIFSQSVRERMLREVEASMRRDAPNFEWYTPAAEKLLNKLLTSMPTSQTHHDPERPRRTHQQMDLEAFWLLCRTQVGCIEAALHELDETAAHASRLKRRWRGAKKGPLPALSALWHSSDSDLSLGIVGSRGSRLGMGSRVRSLLRTERALATIAGQLHDLRVGLTLIGGEWLEYGRWLGGPPLHEIEWEEELSTDRRSRLLKLCGQTDDLLNRTAAALSAQNVYKVNRFQIPNRNTETANDYLSSPSRDELIEATRRGLASLRLIRRCLSKCKVPGELRPPTRLVRQNAPVWAALFVASLASIIALQTADTRAAVERTALKLVDDTQRFVQTHLLDPVHDIARELSHGYVSTIEHEQVEASRASLKRSLEDFVRSVYSSSPSSVYKSAMRKAAVGSMEPVSQVWEEQMRSPLNGLLRGELARAMLLQVEHLRLLLEEQVAAVDQIFRRNDFSFQIMATIPAFIIGFLLVTLLRGTWARLRSSARGPVEEIRADLIAIEGMLTRQAETSPQSNECLTSHEASRIDVTDAGELVFRVQRLRRKGGRWLRGWLRSDVLHDAQELLDSGRLTVKQRARIAQSLLRRMDNVNAIFQHW